MSSSEADAGGAAPERGPRVSAAAARQWAAGESGGPGVVAVRFPGQPHAYQRPPHLAQTLDQVAAACAGLRLGPRQTARTVGFAAGGPQTLTGAEVALATGLEVLNPELPLVTIGPGGAIELELVVGSALQAEANAGTVPLKPRGAAPRALLAEPLYAPRAGLVEAVTPTGLRLSGTDLPLADYRRCGSVLQPGRLRVTTGWEVAAGELVGGYEEAAAELVAAPGGCLAVSAEVAEGVLSRLELTEVSCRRDLLDRALAADPARLDHRGVAYLGAGARTGDVLLACRPQPVLCPTGVWQVLERHESAGEVRLLLVTRRALAVGDWVEVQGHDHRVEAVVPPGEPGGAPAHLTLPGAAPGELLTVRRR